MINDIENFTNDLISQGNGPHAVADELSDLYGLTDDEAKAIYKKCKGISGSLERHIVALDKYRPEYATTAYKLLLIGRTFDDIAAHFRVDVYTLNTWRFEVDEFADAWEQAILRDLEVAETSPRMATG